MHCSAIAFPIWHQNVINYFLQHFKTYIVVLPSKVCNIYGKYSTVLSEEHLTFRLLSRQLGKISDAYIFGILISTAYRRFISIAPSWFCFCICLHGCLHHLKVSQAQGIAFRVIRFTFFGRHGINGKHAARMYRCNRKRLPWMMKDWRRWALTSIKNVDLTKSWLLSTGHPHFKMYGLACPETRVQYGTCCDFMALLGNHISLSFSNATVQAALRTVKKARYAAAALFFFHCGSIFCWWSCE